MKIIAFVLSVFLVFQALPAVDGVEKLEATSGREDLSSEAVPFSLAEKYLQELAQEIYRGRRRWGAVYLGLGAVSVIGGLSMTSSAKESNDFGAIFEHGAGLGLILVGAGIGIAGTVTMATPSGAERKYEFVKSLSEPEERERASREALAGLAKSKRTKRLIWGSVSSALAIVSVVDNGDYSGTVIFGGFALYQFLRRSKEEKVYQEFLGASVKEKELNFTIGPIPRGGFAASLSISF
ncbi:MAG: hypothetical protein JW786_13070 [Desulfobacterales bacterium]|nr:hypothetical protein [Desulfobacterales bacterium]